MVKSNVKLNLVLITTFIFYGVHLINAETSVNTENYILCNITQHENKCPENSACKEFTEKEKNVTRCDCLADFEWNSNKTNCVKVTPATTPAAVPTTSVITTSTSTLAPATKENVTTAAPKTDPPVTQKSTTTTTTTLPPATTTVETKKPNVTLPDDPTKKAIDTGSHHVFGGIVIPIFLVIAILGSVFAVKKYDLIQRARDYFRGRHYHSNYEDILTMNDSDDDPPLI